MNSTFTYLKGKIKWFNFYFTFFFFSISIQLAFAQPGAIDDQVYTNITKSLDGFKWKMKPMNPGEGMKQGLHQLPPGDIETLVWNNAQVPGDVYTDLWKAGIIDDPYFGRNATKAQWVMGKEWWYTTQFIISEELKDKQVTLNFSNIDYSCTVWLNGHLLGKHEGAFSPFSFNVTNEILASQNWLKNKNMLVILLDPPPQVNYKTAGKKTPWFGDYWRDLVPFGLTGNISLHTTGQISLDDTYVKTTINEAQKKATLSIESELFNHTNQSKSVIIESKVESENFKGFESITKHQSITLKPGLNKVKLSKIVVENPKLWWPWDLGDPSLYKITQTIKVNNTFSDQKETVFGIREITTEFNPGFTKDEVTFPRTVKINGKKHFIRSACWGGPPDIFVGRTSIKEYEKLIHLAKNANMNNIRIFGWHPPEIPAFYEFCDRLGITVWQDVIPLGTGNLLRKEEALAEILNEAVEVIKVRRNHPSLILIEGGEEMFLRASDPPFTSKFLKRLGDSLTTYLDLPYVPDSPLTSETALSVGYKPKEAVHALAYFYSMGKWPMEEWFKSLDFPIVPELAITSVPNVESLKKFIPENEMWPPGLSWGYHWADLDRLRFQNFDAFGDEKTGDLETFVNATQDAQGIIFQLSIEHFRRNKPKTSGISLCHFITYWPDMKWGIIDNYQQPKRSYEYVKTAYQPLLVSMNFKKRRWLNTEKFEGEIWIINDLFQKFKKLTAEVTIKNKEGKVIYKTTEIVDSIPEDSAFKAFDFSEVKLNKVNDSFNVYLTLKTKKGESVSSNKYMILIGDQRKAAEHFSKLGKELRDRNAKYSYGNYFRFFPSLTGESEKSYQSQTDRPVARGFKK